MSVVREAFATCWLAGLVLGCHDVVIGTFFASDGGSGSAGGSSTSDTGEPDAPPLPGGCVVEDFDGTPDDALWATWIDADATLAAGDGSLRLTAPTVAETSTGFVLNNELAFGFGAASARVEVVTPPGDDPTQLFLQVTQQAPLTQAVLSVALFQGTARATAFADDGSMVFSEEVASSYPRWLGIRTADGVVHFESSTDGETWTELASFAQPSDFVGAAPLVMAWNNPFGNVAAPQPVVLDNFTICAD